MSKLGHSDETYGNQEHYYNFFYSKMIGLNSAGFLSKLSKYPHKLMEKPFKSNLNFKILELGSGEGEHIPFVASDYKQYIASDLRELIHTKVDNANKIETQVIDAHSLPFSDGEFNRVIAGCLIAHLSDPETALLEWYRVLKPGGVLTIYIPAEPGLALRLFRSFVSKPKATKIGFNGYDLFISREHVNDANRLVFLLREFFLSCKIIYSPFRIRTWYFNLFIIAHIKKINL